MTRKTRARCREHAGFFREHAYLVKHEADRVILLSTLDGKTVKQTADSLPSGVSQSSVRNRERLHRAIRDICKQKRAHSMCRYVLGFDDSECLEKRADKIRADEDAMRALPLKKRPIETLGLGGRAENCLRNSGAKIIDDVLSIGGRDYYFTPNLGPETFKEIVRALESIGLDLRRETDWWETCAFLHPKWKG